MNFLPLIASLAPWGIQDVTANPIIQPDMAAVFSQEYTVLEANRVALTPVLDGVLANEEWDELNNSETLTSYQQWEPGVLYLASKAAQGKDVLYSVDLEGDGWLVGKENLELRVSWADGAPVVTARMLDASNRNEPTWSTPEYLEGLLKSAGSATEGRWSAEVKLLGLLTPEFAVGRTSGIRVDLVDSGASTGPAYLPRKTTPITMRFDRSKGLPSGMEWMPEYKVRTVMPGDNIKIRLNFSHPGSAKFTRASMETIGYGREATKQVALPFPEFDRKGRAFVDYETPVSENALKGYRVLKAVVQQENGEPVEIMTSYVFSDVVSFYVNIPRIVKPSPDSQIIRGSIDLKSHSKYRIKGNFSINVPETWTVRYNKTKSFLITSPRGSTKVNLEFIAPQGARGLIPLSIRADVGEKAVQETIYLSLQE